MCWWTLQLLPHFTYCWIMVLWTWIYRYFLLYCVVNFLFNEEPLYCFPQWLYLFTFPPTVHKSSNCFTSLPTFGYFLLNGSQNKECKVIFPSSFNLRFLMFSDVECLFMCLLVMCTSLEKCWFKSFAYFWIRFFFFLLNLRNSLNIINIKSFQDAWFANIFSCSVTAFLFCWYFISIFKFKNFFIQYNNLSIFYFVACTLCAIFNKSVPNPILWNFCNCSLQKWFDFVCRVFISKCSLLFLWSVIFSLH